MSIQITKFKLPIPNESRFTKLMLAKVTHYNYGNFNKSFPMYNHNNIIIQKPNMEV